ncbi:hypothetical protein CYMTET_7483 [Cymbomonas tetramitiformis]|uniref:Membrane transporter protein n=1 Tax=Cymbomonas tetramitiformis TaxID=36881 RepID=A0AAE0GVL0_9CHLO|nr:hypothetical protein CYMTET_7483 [Cymbomonas tetramitiformis]
MAIPIRPRVSAFAAPFRSSLNDEYSGQAQDTARKIAGPVGLVAGLFGSLVGVGGGVLIVPVITGTVVVPQRIVAASSLAAVISTGSVAAWNYHSNGSVDFGSAALLSVSAMATAPLGARLTSRMDCAALRKALGYFLLVAAPLVPLKAYLLHSLPKAAEVAQGGALDQAAPTGPTAVDALGDNSWSEDSPSSTSAARPEGTGGATFPAKALQWPGTTQSALLVAMGSVAGLASGLLGIGGGTLVTPMLALTMPMTQQTVLGTSLFAMIFPASVGLLQHHFLGNVDWRMAAALSIGTAVGSTVGSNLAIQSPDGVLEVLFGLGMLFLGRKTLASVR